MTEGTTIVCPSHRMALNCPSSLEGNWNSMPDVLKVASDLGIISAGKLERPPSTCPSVRFSSDVKISAFTYHADAKDHSKAYELLGALRYEDLLEKYVKKYNVRYLVVALGDRYGIPVREYENRPNLVKVYENQFGERIYYYVNVDKDGSRVFDRRINGSVG